MIILYPNPSAMEFYDALGDRQTKTGARVSAMNITSVELVKNTLLVFIRYSAPGIAYAYVESFEICGDIDIDPAALI